MGPKKSSKTSYSRSKEAKRNAKRAAKEKQSACMPKVFQEDYTEELRVPRGGEGPEETRILRGFSTPLDEDDNGTMVSVLRSSSENTLVPYEEYDPENPSVPPGFEALGTPSEQDEWHETGQFAASEKPPTETKEEVDTEADIIHIVTTQFEDKSTLEHVRCRLEMMHDNWQTLIIDMNYLSSSLSTVEVAYGKLVVFQRITFTMPEKFNLGTLYCLVSEQKRFQKKLDFIRYQFNEAEQTVNDNQADVVTMYDVYEFFRVDANKKLATIHSLFNEMVGKNVPGPDGTLNLEQIVAKNTSSQEELRDFHYRQETAIAAHEVAAGFLNAFRECLTQVEYVIQTVTSSLNIARSKLHSFRAKCYRLRVARSEFLKKHNLKSYEIDVFTYLKAPARDSLDDINILTAEEFVKTIRDQPIESHIQTKRNTGTSPVQKVNESTSTADINSDSISTCQVMYANAPIPDESFLSKIVDFSIADDRCGTPPLISMDLDVNNVSPMMSVVSHRGINTIIKKTRDFATDNMQIDVPTIIKPVILKTDASVTCTIKTMSPLNQTLSYDEQNKRKRKARKNQKSIYKFDETTKQLSQKVSSSNKSNTTEIIIPSYPSVLQTGWSVTPLQHSDTVIYDQFRTIDNTASDDFDFLKPRAYELELEENSENDQTVILNYKKVSSPSSNSKSWQKQVLISPPPADGINSEKQKHHKSKHHQGKNVVKNSESPQTPLFEQNKANEATQTDDSALKENIERTAEETISDKEKIKKPKRKSKKPKKQNEEPVKIVQSIEKEDTEKLGESTNKLEITKKLLDTTKTLKDIITQNKDEAQKKKTLPQSTIKEDANTSEVDRPKEKGKKTPGIMTKNKIKKINQSNLKDEHTSKENSKLSEDNKMVTKEITLNEQFLKDKANLEDQKKMQESIKSEQIPTDSPMILSEKFVHENKTNRLAATLSNMMTQDFNLDHFVATHMKNEADLKELLGCEGDITAVEVAVIFLNSFRDHLAQFEHCVPRNIPVTTEDGNLKPGVSLFDNQTLETVNSESIDTQLVVSNKQELEDPNKISILLIDERTENENNVDNLEPVFIAVEHEKQALEEIVTSDINQDLKETEVKLEHQQQFHVSLPGDEKMVSCQTMQIEAINESDKKITVENKALMKDLEEFIIPIKNNKQEIEEQEQTHHKLGKAKLESVTGKEVNLNETEPVYIEQDKKLSSKKRKRKRKDESVIIKQTQMENQEQLQNVSLDNEQTSERMSSEDLESDQLKLTEHTSKLEDEEYFQNIAKDEDIAWERINVRDLDPIFSKATTSKVNDPEVQTDAKTDQSKSDEDAEPTEADILNFIDEIYGKPKQKSMHREADFIKKYMLSNTRESSKTKSKMDKKHVKKISNSSLNTKTACIYDRIKSQYKIGAQSDSSSRSTTLRKRQDRKFRTKTRANKILSEINLQKELESTCSFIVDAIKSSLLNTPASETKHDSDVVKSEQENELTTNPDTIKAKDEPTKLRPKQKQDKTKYRHLRRTPNDDIVPSSEVTQSLKVDNSINASNAKGDPEKVNTSKNDDQIMYVEINQPVTPSTSNIELQRIMESLQPEMLNAEQEQMQTIDEATSNTETDQPSTSIVEPQPETTSFLKPVTVNNKTEMHRPRKEIATEVKIKIKSRPLLHPDVNIDKKLDPDALKWKDKNRKDSETDDMKEPRPILGQQEILLTPTSAQNPDLGGEGSSRIRHKRLGKFCDPILSKRSARILDQHKIHEKDSTIDPNSQTKKEINIYNKKGKGFKSIKKSAKDSKYKSK